MSRSFKKVPGYVDRNPFMKRYSNKSLRRISKAGLQALSDPEQYDDKVSMFSSYKRCSVNPYDICDWRSLYFSKKELMASCVYRSSYNFSYISLFAVSTDEASSVFTESEHARMYYKATTK